MSDSNAGIIVDSTGCKTSGDIQDSSYDSSSLDTIIDIVLIGTGLLVVIIIVVLVIVFKDSFVNSTLDQEFEDWWASAENESDDDYMEMEGLVNELERQRAESHKEIERLRIQQVEQQSSAAEAAMQNAMLELQQRVENTETAKMQLKSELEKFRSNQENTFQIQDSAVAG